MPRLCELYPGICLTTEEKTWKNLRQGSRRVPVGTVETEINMQPQTAVGRKFFPTSNSQFNLFAKKNPNIRIFCISGWLAAPFNPDKWRYSL